MSTNQRRVWTAFSLCALWFALPASAQDLTHKAPAQSQGVLITGVTLHPVSGPPTENSFVLFDGGVIKRSGPVGDVKPSDAKAGNWRVIDAKGKHVYPGLISPFSHIGLTEIQSVAATIDTSETGGVTPEVRAAIAVNPDSTLIPVARTNGVLVAGVFPEGGTISGQVAVIQLDGWTMEQMAV